MEGLQSCALSCHKSDSPTALYIFMQPSTFILSTYIFVLSLHLYTYNLSIFICTFYMLFICSLHYIPFTFILYPHLYVLYILCTPIHLCLSTFLCASTFNTAPTLYALYIFYGPLIHLSIQLHSLWQSYHTLSL